MIVTNHLGIFNGEKPWQNRAIMTHSIGGLPSQKEFPPEIHYHIPAVSDCLVSVKQDSLPPNCVNLDTVLLLYLTSNYILVLQFYMSSKHKKHIYRFMFSLIVSNIIKKTNEVNQLIVSFLFCFHLKRVSIVFNCKHMEYNGMVQGLGSKVTPYGTESQ